MREFSVGLGGATLANAVVTLVIENPAAAPAANIEFLRFWVGQSANATSAQQRVQLETQVTAFPTLVSATPAKLKRHDGAVSIIAGGTAGAAGTSGVNASAEGAGSKTIILDDAFNVLNGWLSVPTPSETIVMPASSTSGLGMYFPVAAATLTNWSFGLNFREV
jgi:hypothetical protein